MKNFNSNIYTIFSFLIFFNLNFSVKLLAHNKKSEWQPVGVDNYGNITQWINPSSYKSLNKDSFRMKIKLLEGNKNVRGRLDINCRNKDYYLRKKREMSQKDPWNKIIKGSSFYEIAEFYCKRTYAASNWGYTTATKYLWDIEKPTYSASSHEGNWVTLYKNNSSEFKYNLNTQENSGYVLAAYFYQQNQLYKNTKSRLAKSYYGWIAVSCRTNLHSTFKKFGHLIEGEWTAPKKGVFGGGASFIRKAKCEY